MLFLSKETGLLSRCSARTCLSWWHPISLGDTVNMSVVEGVPSYFFLFFLSLKLNQATRRIERTQFQGCKQGEWNGSCTLRDLHIKMVVRYLIEQDLADGAYVVGCPYGEGGGARWGVSGPSGSILAHLLALCSC